MNGYVPDDKWNYQQFAQLALIDEAELAVKGDQAFAFFLSMARFPKSLAAMPHIRRWAFALAFFQWVAVAEVIASIACLFWRHWIIAIVLIWSAWCVRKAVFKSAAQEVARLAMTDESWFYELQNRGLAEVRLRSGSSSQP